MVDRSDNTYPLLEKALNLLTESKAKLEFLNSKIENRLTDLEDEELSVISDRSVALGERFDGGKQSGKLKLSKAKAGSLQTSLDACREKCQVLQEKVQRLIEVKDTLLCQSIVVEPLAPHVELLPGGTRTDRMKLELSNEVSECSICNEVVKRVQPIWSCRGCYNIFHLQCAGQWMDATKNNGEWNCPTCRRRLEVTFGGLRYTCFCGRVDLPKPASNVTPHSCGQKCLKGCRVLCHPGPCSAA